MILSKVGTVRGIKHRSLQEEERSQCVVYLTSLGVIRNTLQRCSNVSKIFRNFFVRVVEKDLYLCPEYKAELEARLDTPLSSLKLPIVFLRGVFLGDEAGLLRLNEAGELRPLVAGLRDKEAVARREECPGCGGAGWRPCGSCGGGGVTTNIWHGAVRLRCTHCSNTSPGLVRCTSC